MSAVERRSLNNEILVILERGALQRIGGATEGEVRCVPVRADRHLGKATGWEDSRSTRQIVDDIYSTRTAGRDVNL